ncbi:MAG: AzlD domain-containing protein [Reyranellaceae bacterium]
MIEFAAVLGLGLVLYAMKALPFVFGKVPQSQLGNQVLDLLPVGLLTALLLPPALIGAMQDPAIEALLAIGAVVVALGVSAVTGQAALSIAAGLVILAIAETI